MALALRPRDLRKVAADTVANLFDRELSHPSIGDFHPALDLDFPSAEGVAINYRWHGEIEYVRRLCPSIGNPGLAKKSRANCGRDGRRFE